MRLLRHLLFLGVVDRVLLILVRKCSPFNGRSLCARKAAGIRTCLRFLNDRLSVILFSNFGTFLVGMGSP